MVNGGKWFASPFSFCVIKEFKLLFIIISFEEIPSLSAVYVSGVGLIIEESISKIRII